MKFEDTCVSDFVEDFSLLFSHFDYFESYRVFHAFIFCSFFYAMKACSGCSVSQKKFLSQQAQKRKISFNLREVYMNYSFSID